MAYIGNPANLGNLTTNTEMSNLKKSLNNQNTFNSAEKWERMAMASTGGAWDYDYTSCTFDGRYVYFTPFNSYYFNRYDSTQSFTASSSWQQINLQTAQGGAHSQNAYIGCTFDGRYIYFTAANSTTFIRYDNTLPFTAGASWQQIAVTSATGVTALAAGYAYFGCTFDGRYIYFSAAWSDTFIRYDSTQAFNASNSWQQMSMWSAQGATQLDYAYLGCTFDGRYIYFTASYSDTFIRYDTTQTFNASASWQQVSIWSAQGGVALDQAYIGCTFDGRYVYFAPNNSDTFIRYDSTQSFTTSGSWQQISMWSAQGATVLDGAYIGCTFDGRYIYFTASNSNTFIRYDTTASFTTAASWQQIAMSSGQGGATVYNAYFGNGTFDGRYVYFPAYRSATLIRFLANNTGAKGPIEYARVSS